MWPNFKPSFSKGNEGGFTLIEVLIAVTILAAISLAMYGATTQMLSSKELVEGRDETQHAITYALEKMADDISMAYILRSPDMLGNKFDGEVAFEGGEDRLDFVSFSHLRYLKGAKESDSSEISYYLAPDPENSDAQALMRRESTTIDKNFQEGGRAYPLLEGVRSLRFEYLPAPTEEWKRVWDSKSLSTGNKLPRAVKIELEMQLPDEEAPKTYSTISLIRLRDPLLF